MRALPTLGGTHGFATGANNLGHAVGWAETTVQGPSCTAPQKFQFIAVRWDSNDRPHRLEPLPGDSTSAATAINDLGQVVAISGACSNAVGGLSARKNVLWDANGNPTDIGDLGGVSWNTPMMINNLGDIVGFANVATTAANDPRAFVKLRGRSIRSLGTLPGDVAARA